MQPQQAQPKRLELTPQELERVLRRKRQSEPIKVSPEELMVAEFGYYFGWEAMVAILNNEISLEDAGVLLAGARKVWSAKVVDLASVIYTASAASQSGKKAKSVMNKGLKEFIKQAKADM